MSRLSSSCQRTTPPTRKLPFKRLDFYPWEDIKANKNIIAAITPRGAHGHFVVGNNLTRWFKKPMSDFLNAVDERSKAPPKQ
jgi:hypothetical protein